MNNWSFLKVLVDTAKEPFRYAAVPFGYNIDEDRFRLYFSTRDQNNKSVIYTTDVDLNSLEVVSPFTRINIEHGGIGFFDSDGVLGTSIIKIDGTYYLYYIGWNRGTDVPFRNAIGLATSTDGIHFKKYSNGPIIDRSIHDPCFTASCEVKKHLDGYLMYYLSCIEWKMIDGKLMHKYHLKIAESKDAINWSRDGQIAIDFRYENEYAISVPRYIELKEGPHLYYSFRASPQSEHYIIGRAISKNKDPKSWKRLDDVEVEKVQNLNNVMSCYPFLIKHKNSLYMLFNGNGFGATGVCISKLLTSSL